MKNWTIKRRILGSFCVILAVMALMAAVAYTRLAEIQREAISFKEDSTRVVLFDHDQCGLV